MTAQAVQASTPEQMIEQVIPQEDRPLLQHAIEFARPIVNRIMPDGEVALATLYSDIIAGNLGSTPMLAMAFWCAMDRLCEIVDRGTIETGKEMFGCGWCYAAATSEAERNALQTFDELKPALAHELVCEHNRLAQVVRDYIDARDHYEQTPVGDPEFAPATLALVSAGRALRRAVRP